MLCIKASETFDATTLSRAATQISSQLKDLNGFKLTLVEARSSLSRVMMIIGMHQVPLCSHLRDSNLCDSSHQQVINSLAVTNVPRSPAKAESIHPPPKSSNRPSSTSLHHCLLSSPCTSQQYQPVHNPVRPNPTPQNLLPTETYTSLSVRSPSTSAPMINDTLEDQAPWVSTSPKIRRLLNFRHFNEVHLIASRTYTAWEHLSR